MMRGIICQFNATDGSSDTSSCLKAEGHFGEKKSVQEPKSDDTISKDMNLEKNRTERELSDLSASKRMRGRSPHSSRDPKNPKPRKTKGDSERTSTLEQGSRSKITSPNLRMLVQSKLEQYKDRNGKYNGLVRILADPGFLQLCYMLIKGNPGNMSKGVIKETLDGLTYEWFCKVAEEIKTGKFKFTPVRRVNIPKPGKKGLRPLGVGAPREKIVQKGIQLILETIYEDLFLDCSHGFRPNRSTHSALKPLYLRAHQFT